MSESIKRKANQMNKTRMISNNSCAAKSKISLKLVKKKKKPNNNNKKIALVIGKCTSDFFEVYW